jgi:ABC-type Zn2+ transport system substrate-binding protein/surface adhesin
MLYSFGFKFANIVGRKVVEVYLLAQQLLSPQRHYDWGSTHTHTQTHTHTHAHKHTHSHTHTHTHTHT